MDQAVGVATQAGTNLVESGVLGCLVILQFALLGLMGWLFMKLTYKFLQAINRNTDAIEKFQNLMQGLPCFDERKKTCEFGRTEK